MRPRCMSIPQEDTHLAIVGRWVVRYAILGTVFGAFLMFSKTPPIAESGGKPDDVLWYAFWIPVMAIFGSIVGVLFGLVAVIWFKLREWSGTA